MEFVRKSDGNFTEMDVLQMNATADEDTRLLHSPSNGSNYRGYLSPFENPEDGNGGRGERADGDSTEISSCSLKVDGPDKVHISNNKAFRKLIIACSLCAFFIICEIVGGSLAHSLAIMTDAAHLVTDLISFLISLFAILLVRKGPSKRLNFGWYRAEMLGALFSIQLIWVVTGVLVYLGIERIRTMNFELNATTMLITASIGVVVNLIMATVLHQHVPTGHGHSHGLGGGGHGHSHSHGHSHEGSNINVRAAFIHCVGDLLQSIGVLVAAFVVYFKPEYKIADPICTFISSMFVLGTTFFIFRDAIYILMEGAPQSVKSRDLYTRLMSIGGVSDVHNIRLWSLTTDKVACNIHILVDPEMISSKEALKKCHDILTGFAFHDFTVQIEETHLETFLNVSSNSVSIHDQ